MRKTLVILANSVKYGQHCVAGKELGSGRWIRPVMDSTGTELPRNQINYQNPYGTYAVRPLLKIEMEFTGHAPLVFQPENYIINPDYLWQQRYSIEPSDLPGYFDTPECIWPMGHSSFGGMNDRVPYSQIVSRDIQIPQSLYLIKPDDLIVHVTQDQSGNKRLRAVFGYNGEQYNIAVTDPGVGELFEYDPGGYRPSEVNGLCLSLGVPFDGYCYKLAVAIL